MSGCQRYKSSIVVEPHFARKLPNIGRARNTGKIGALESAIGIDLLFDLSINPWWHHRVEMLSQYLSCRSWTQNTYRINRIVIWSHFSFAWGNRILFQLNQSRRFCAIQRWWFHMFWKWFTYFDCNDNIWFEQHFHSLHNTHTQCVNT